MFYSENVEMANSLEQNDLTRISKIHINKLKFTVKSSQIYSPIDVSF